MASPRDLDPLNINAEKQRIELGLASMTGAGLAKLVWVDGQTSEHLRDALAKEKWHIFHFVGHGGTVQGGESFISLCDENGNEDRLSAGALAQLLEGLLSLRLVILNSCYSARGGQHDVFSSTASVLVHHNIPAVIAMQFAITDAAAIEFSSSFYRSLARGNPFDQAVTEARQEVSRKIKGSLEWGTPILFTRAPGKALFSRQPDKPPENPPVLEDPSPPIPLVSPIPRKPDDAKPRSITVNWLLGGSFVALTLALIIVVMLSGSWRQTGSAGTPTATLAATQTSKSVQEATAATAAGATEAATAAPGSGFTLPSLTLDATATALAKATLAASTETPEPTLAPTPTPEPVETPTSTPVYEPAPDQASAAALSAPDTANASAVAAVLVPNQPPDGAVFPYPLSPVFQWSREELAADQHYLLEIIHGAGTDVHVLDEPNWLSDNWMVVPANQPRDGIFQWHVALCQGGRVGNYSSIAASQCERTGEFSTMLTFRWINPQPDSPLAPPIYVTVVP